MTTKPRKPLTDKDGEVRQLTRADIREFRPAKEVVPPELYALMQSRKRGQRGKQKAPTKEQVTLRLDSSVLQYFRMTGDGWQVRINDVLKAIAATGPKITRPKM